ncbi:MAG: DHH family phosphoesterase [Nitrospirae bacterium]|nr:DHH family phosphoesterase [Nitrospirota bacterium]
MKSMVRKIVPKKQIETLVAQFEEADRLVLLTQDDPDPDAIASALAFRHLIGRNRSTAPIASFGEVSRPENQAMVRLLDIPVEKIDTQGLRDYDHICLLDVQPTCFCNTISMKDVDVVIDHHPEQPGYAAGYKDIRANYGATSTILTEYLRTMSVNISQRLATALLYGIKSDTFLLGRGVHAADIEAFSFLYPLANNNVLRRIERPEVHPEDIDSFSTALRKRKIIKNVLFSHLGKVKRDDVIPRFADFCLQIEGIEWTVVSGTYRNQLIVSVRNVGYVRSAGTVVRQAFGDLGSAGGHSYMAKAVIPMAKLKEKFGVPDRKGLRQLIIDRFMGSFTEDYASPPNPKGGC